MTQFKIECNNHSDTEFFVSDELDDWVLEHHNDALKLDSHAEKFLDCTFSATEIIGGESIE